MSNLAMTPEEQKDIDTKIERMMDWARTRKAEADQLALDSARLMACTEDRLDRIQNQGFFKRCWYRFSGKAGEMERANVNDLIQMQKTAFRYVNMLEEQQLLTASALLSLKNNLNSIAIKEEETRKLITLLAQNTLERFEKLESRVDQLEISSNLQGWLLTLEEREYERKYPTEFIRLFKVINDFYRIKDDNWNYNDLMFMRKAIRTVGLNPNEKISLNSFINKLVDEIQTSNVGFKLYDDVISEYSPQGIENYSKFVINNISSPVLVSLHGLNLQYMDKLDVVQELQDEMNISMSEALKRLIRRNIGNMNVNLDYEIPLAEIAIEILSSLRLVNNLISEGNISSIKDNPYIITPESIEMDDVEISEKGLFEYVEEENLDKIKYVLAHGVNPNCFDHDGETPLMKAAQYSSNKDILELLIRNGAEVDLEDESKETAFSKTVSILLKENNASTLLKLGADINHVDESGHTPLMNASLMGFIENIKFLLDNGADINYVHEDESALTCAINLDRLDVVDILIERGVNINQENSDGAYPMNGTIFLGRIEMFEKLLAAGGRVADSDVIEFINNAHTIGFIDDDIHKQLLEIARNTTVRLIFRLKGTPIGCYHKAFFPYRAFGE